MPLMGKECSGGIGDRGRKVEEGLRGGGEGGWLTFPRSTIEVEPATMHLVWVLICKMHFR